MLKSGLRIKTLTNRGGPNDPNPPSTTQSSFLSPRLLKFQIKQKIKNETLLFLYSLSKMEKTKSW